MQCFFSFHFALTGTAVLNGKSSLHRCYSKIAVDD